MGTLGPIHSSVGTSVGTPAELSAVVDNSLARGSWGYVASTDSYYSYQPLSVVPVGPSALASFSSQAGAFPGRWLLVMAASGGDKFAPRYLVGNIPAGDIAPDQPGSFRYIADPGDGTGLRAALLEALLDPGDVHVRPGTYDFNLGPIDGPLTVPGGCTVSGAGAAITIIRGKEAGALDQGVFVLPGHRSGLRDLGVRGGDGPAASLSTALVVMSGTHMSLSDVEVIATVTRGHALQDGILFVSFFPPPPDMADGISPSMNVTIRILGDTGNCLHLSASNGGAFGVEFLTTTGGAIGALVEGGSLFADQALFLDAALFGVSHDNNNGSLRLQQGLVFAPAVLAGSWTGIRIKQGAGHLLLGMTVLAGRPTAGATGIHLGDLFEGPSVTAAQVSGCLTIGMEVGVLVGDTGEACNDVEVTENTIIESFGFGVLAVEPSSKGLLVSGNTVLMTEVAPTAPVGISVSGVGHRVVDNTVRINSADASSAQGILVLSNSAVVDGNVVEARTTLPLVDVAARSTVTGNVLNKLSDNDAFVLQIGSDSTVTGNTVRNPQGVASTSAAIGLLGSFNTVTGNRTYTAPNVEGIKAVPLGGSGSAIMSNVCEGPGSDAAAVAAGASDLFMVPTVPVTYLNKGF